MWKKINKIKKYIFVSYLISILFLYPLPVAMSSVVTNSSNVLEEKKTIDQNDVICFQKQYWAVLIGINDYPGTWGDLPYSISEINSFKKTLLTKGNWKESHIKMITDAEATHDNIIDALEWLGEQETSLDVSIVYFVGHGGKIDKNYSFSAYNSKIFDYELDAVFDSFDGRIVLIMDCCNSGGFVETVKGRGRMIMAACDKDGLTYQYKPLKSGFFGYFLNVTLEKLTNTAEMTFLIAAPITYLYSCRLSKELGEDYIVKPKASDMTLGLTVLIKPRWMHTFKISLNELIPHYPKLYKDELWVL